MKVENNIANEIFIAAKKGKQLQKFMDTVSGVNNYRLNNLSRQGHVRSMFSKELISDQFLIELEDIISVFWHGVFDHLDRAKLFGEVVEIKAPGKHKEFRKTNNNPIHFLRYHGRMAVRNYISLLYRRNLEQGCSKCGHKITVCNNKECPKCDGTMSATYRFVEINTDEDNLYNFNLSKEIEDKNTESNFFNILKLFAEEELKSGTRAYQVLKIFIDPLESVNMCKACGLCASKTFDIESCTNYNANIGNWLGVNKTMIASKVKRIRNALPKWLSKQDNDEAKYMLHILPDKFKVLR